MYRVIGICKVSIKVYERECIGSMKATHSLRDFIRTIYEANATCPFISKSLSKSGCLLSVDPSGPVSNGEFLSVKWKVPSSGATSISKKFKESLIYSSRAVEEVAEQKLVLETTLAELGFESGVVCLFSIDTP